MRSYYNENDPYAAQWLRQLVAAGHLPAGDVDQRSILDVEPGDLDGYDQVHWFAGIGGWGLALELAGWPADRPVWTGSCPCQPFSSAGKQSGAADERHLWPAWLRLIRECRPDAVIGEQVEGAVGFGWLDRVFADLEAEGYACGAAVLGAHSVNAPHIRQRLFWVADAGEPGSEGWVRGRQDTGREDLHRHVGCGVATGGLADARHDDGTAWPARREHEPEPSIGERLGSNRSENPWDAAVWLPCLDGKARRAQPGIFPLAHGVPSRVGRLRAYGNAITPQAAAAFVMAFMECRNEQ